MEKSNPVSIRRARKEDVAAIQGLLQSAKLPFDDVGEHVATFLVAVAGNRVVGSVGLEAVGSSGLLRSLVVAEDLRGIGLGKRLYNEIVGEARHLGVRTLGLLTTTAEGFFAREGFVKQERSNIPAIVASSKEYRVYCPSTAVIMTKTIG